MEDPALLLRLVVLVLTYICPISLVTCEMSAMPQELVADEVDVRIVGGEVTNIKNYPFIVRATRPS